MFDSRISLALHFITEIMKMRMKRKIIKRTLVNTQHVSVLLGKQTKFTVGEEKHVYFVNDKDSATSQWIYVHLLPSFYLLLQSLARHLKIRRREYIIYSTIYFSWSSQTVWYLVFWDNCCNSPYSRAWMVIFTGKRTRI